MASEQFILEMHKKLHPHSNIHYHDDLTEADLDRINAIIDDKHSIRLGSKWISDSASVDLKTLRNVLVSASLGCHGKLEVLINDLTAGDMADGHGHIDPEAVTKWEDDVAYYQDQLDAIKAIEAFLETLQAATHTEDFYMQGVTI